MSQKLTLALILVCYLALATLFAVTTPAWQNPDEPAHYNYIAHIARGDGLPVLRMGDYDQERLETLKREGFPPDRATDWIRYEFHQPPLYYLTAAPIFWLTDGNLLALRLYSILLGGGVISLTFLAVRTIFPNQAQIVLGATAFVAFLPMHVAMMASVNNDPLAELIIAAAVLVLLRWIVSSTQRRKEAKTQREGQGARGRGQRHTSEQTHSSFHLVTLSLLLGLGMVTKATAYILLPVSVIVIGAVTLWGRKTTDDRRPTTQRATRNAQLKRLITHYALLIIPSLLLALPLWIRNITLYGNFDFLGLNWHNEVVTGQPATADWIAANGWAAYWDRAWEFTFKSFWGIFGWMGVFMDQRVYTALLVFSVIGLAGFVIWLGQKFRREFGLSTAQRWQLATLLLLILAVGASYIWYNLGFVQHQGRYLFPALLALAVVAAVGWHQAFWPKTSLWLGMALLLWAGLAAGTDLLAGMLDKWTVLILGLGSAALLGNFALAWRSFYWTTLRPFLYTVPFVFLILLDAVIPFLYIIPQLVP